MGRRNGPTFVDNFGQLCMLHRVSLLKAWLDDCEGCGGQLNNVNGSFASPNYPSPVTTGFTCQWMIRVPARRVVNLRLTVRTYGAAAAAESDCSSSNVTVTVYNSAGSAQLLGTYCTAVSHDSSV